MLIKNKNMTIRNMEQSDLSNLIKWFNNKDLTKFYDERFENNDAVIKKYLTRINDPSKITPCILEINNVAVGYMQFYKIDSSLHKKLNFDLELNVYGIDQFLADCSIWGKGIGTEFIKMILNYLVLELNVDSIVLDVKINNIRAIKSYKKCGFKILKQEDSYFYMEWNKANR